MGNSKVLTMGRYVFPESYLWLAIRPTFDIDTFSIHLFAKLKNRIISERKYSFFSILQNLY